MGLDGSLVFLEHVFWVVSLNTLFILVFAFCPYHIGHFTIVGFKVKSYINGAHFEGMSTTLCGKYCAKKAKHCEINKFFSYGLYTVDLLATLEIRNYHLCS